jgi:hypothetical protein
MNELESARAVEALDGVLRSMTGQGPGSLEPRLRLEIEDRQVTADVDGAVSFLLKEIVHGDTNSPGHALFAQHLRGWDAVNEAGWTGETPRLTTERRSLIYSRLRLAPEDAGQLTSRIPIAKSFGSAILIANEHEEWYTEQIKQRRGRYYWNHYDEYLRKEGGWDEAATASLDESTDKVLRCMSDPEREDAFAVRGLVVGYVQSGKTANFTAVIAKAMDAGYRMVVVLAGVLDSLRFQTQRRLDKELAGREQILRDKEEGKAHEYSGDQDWERFVSYGGMPSEQGAFDIRRITTSVSDYQKLGQGRDVLRIEKVHGDRPLNHADNLHQASARIVVIKKHPAVINKFIKDVRGLKMRLDDVPVLVIDDESDQASVNTINPNRKKKEGKADKDRTSTNKAIVDLLAMFPRSQYVGYTATPAANALILPTDTQDLFPRDFIELLPRPANYMGVSDFHDFDDDLNPLGDVEIKDLGFLSNKTAFVRPISDVDDESTLRTALDAFFLTGALKLFRADRKPGSVSTRHHTMLVHRAVSQHAHDSDRDLVVRLYDSNSYRRQSTKARIWKLWTEDFEPVSLAREPNLPRPETIEELGPFFDRALEQFESAKKQVLIVNGRDDHKDDMPDFDKENVWNILVGGAKLSRGYTVEGLTITYFLRKAAAADTLMQMGRWFGFRRGYRDLVRLFIAKNVADGKNKTVDLYELFESICMDEERFRRRIEVYSRDGIRPIEVPPLVPMGMLVPTQKNKMYNAQIEMENFGGRGAESGRAPFNKKDRSWNADQLKTLLGDRLPKRVDLLGTNAKGERQSLGGRAFEAEPQSFQRFLTSYRWGTRESQFSSVIGFLQGTGDESPGIDGWLVVVLHNPSAERKWNFADFEHGVFTRGAVEQRFNVFSESRHRDVAKHLARIEDLQNPNRELVELTRQGQAVCLIYPTIARGAGGMGQVDDKEITVGLSLMFPKNHIRQRINFRVADRSKDAPAFVRTDT